MNKIDELICKRTLVVGNFRPGQNIKLSEFRNRLTDLILKHTELDPGDPRVIKAEWSLELTWTFHESDPYDFDLSLVPPKLEIGRAHV